MEIEPPDDIELELVDGPDAVGGQVPVARLTATARLDFDFVGELWYWRGPSPYHFITVPRDAARSIQAVATAVTYGWGMIPVSVRIGTSD